MVRDGPNYVDFAKYSPKVTADALRKPDRAANDDDHDGLLSGTPRWLIYLFIVAYCAGVWSGGFWLISILF